MGGRAIAGAAQYTSPMDIAQQNNVVDSAAMQGGLEVIDEGDAPSGAR